MLKSSFPSPVLLDCHIHNYFHHRYNTTTTYTNTNPMSTCYSVRVAQDEAFRERFYALRADGKYYSRPRKNLRSAWDETPINLFIEAPYPGEVDPDQDKEEYDIDIVLEIFLSPRQLPLERNRISAYAQVRAMTPRTLKRKVIILGAPSVGMSLLFPLFNSTKAHIIGKTSLAKQYIQPPTYVEGYFPTIEQTEHKQIPFDGINYDCEIIDTAGQVSLCSTY